MEQASLFDLSALLLTLAALFGYVNHRWLRLPTTIGLVLIALFVSFAVLALDWLFPGFGFRAAVGRTLLSIDFHETLMEGMLSFLLFAGALHVDLEQFLARKWVIALLASFGVLTSTALVGLVMYPLFALAGLAVPMILCLVFGALIAPTDPVAVLGILKRVKVPPSLEAKIAGESLFNDGVGVVVFTILVAIATAESGGAPMGAGAIALLFVQEALGGAILGLAAGLLAYQAMKSMDEHNLEVLITLALVTGAYALALLLHVSGPIAMVVAGILIGNHGTRLAMSAKTRDHVEKFWSLTDEILNAVLFLLIGFEVMALSVTPGMLWLMAAAVPVALLARLISVSVPITVLGLRKEFTPGAIPVLTWGGLRGGISVALALSLPDIPEKGVLLAAAYAVVVFSIVVQGLTMERLVRRVVG
jgi:CPA1 family monovalent cation:H+ antiporter